MTAWLIGTVRVNVIRLIMKNCRAFRWRHGPEVMIGEGIDGRREIAGRPSAY
jgi:hypothetical protein